MRFRTTLFIGVVLLAGHASLFAQTKPAPKPAPIAPAAPLKDGWEEIDKRLVFLMVRLANVEASLDAIEKSLGVGTRKQAARLSDAKRAEQGNEMMDRKGGGPVKWSQFYGRTAEKFFYHPTDRNSTYHTTTILSQQSPSADNSPGAGVPSRQGLPVHQRPPQFDYIYKANQDAQARAERDASQLRNKIDALQARRRQLEDEQAALWCQIAFRAVSRYDLARKPLYRFEPAPLDNDTASRQKAEAVKAAAIHMRRALSIIEIADRDQAKAFGSIKAVVADAYSNYDDELLALDSLVEDITDPESAIGRYSALARRLRDVADNISDSYEVSIDGDRFKDELRKDTFRGLLQESLVDYAEVVLAMNEMGQVLEGEFKTKPNTQSPLKFVSLELPERALGKPLELSGGTPVDVRADEMPQKPDDVDSEAVRQRTVAMSVLRLGGKVTIRTHNQELECDDPRSLPQDNFDIEQINYHLNQHVVDRDLAQFGNLTSVKKLWLSGTKITDAGLSHITGLSALEYLYLGGTATTDRGLVAVGELRNLQLLGLFHTRVSDNGIRHLRNLSNLEELNLGGTNVRDRAVKAVLPNCRITRPQ